MAMLTGSVTAVGDNPHLSDRVPALFREAVPYT